MISETPNRRLGAWKLVGTSAIAMILVAAATELDANSERLRAMPSEERNRLLANLQRFDLELTPEQRSSLRELDRRVSELSPDRRAHFEAILRRYHNWLEGLPENRQSELAAKPPGERMALVRGWIKERPLPIGDTPPLLRVLETGELSPFELASAYKIWHALNATQRSQLDHAAEPKRRAALLNRGQRLKSPIPTETRPEDYDEEKWLGLVHDYVRANRPVLLADEAVRKRLEDALRKKGEPLDEAARKKIEVAVNRVEMGRQEILRRLAINLYVSRTRVESVDSERLARFVNELPAWVRTSLDHLPPDEARRRLTFAYRLVFPTGEEIDSPRKSTGKTPKARSAGPRKAGTPARSKAKASASGEEPAPF